MVQSEEKVMHLSIVFALSLATVALCAPTKDNVPEIDETLFVRRGDILVLNSTVARKRNLVVGEHKLWEGGVVPFYIKPQLEKQRHHIYKAMNHISSRTCIRFREKTDADKGYIHIYNGGGCFAYVGRLEQPVPVSLGEGCEYLIAAAHEILHSLGVDHTQCRSDRDSYITVHEENIYKSLRYNYRKLSESENQLLVPFDFDSIMLYGPYMASENGEVTMTAKDPNRELTDPYDRDGMSDYDVEGLNKLYKCEKYGPQYSYRN